MVKLWPRVVFDYTRVYSDKPRGEAELVYQITRARSKWKLNSTCIYRTKVYPLDEAIW